MTQCQSENFDQSRYKIICAPGSPIVKLLHLAKRVAHSELPILILGPTGVGKENLARYIHSVGASRSAPFIDINCGAIPAELFESELFGHTKGAFTGASAARKGFFGLAEEGTLFLDEIGELPYALQAKLLRVLETKTFRPVGASSSLPFKGRIVAATHRNLPSLAKEGRFREDLFYRLAVLCLELPGLVQRKHDIPYLVEHFCQRHKRTMSFTEKAMERLKGHNWTGNIRELKNLIDRLSILSETSVIDVAMLDTFLAYSSTRTESSLNMLVDAVLDMPGEENKLALVEHVLIASALERCKGNKSEAARQLGVNRKAIERRVGKLADYAQDLQSRTRQANLMMQQGHFITAATILETCINRRDLSSASIHDEGLLCEINYLLGVCYQRIRGWMSQDALAYYNKAMELAEKTGKEEITESSMFLIWVSFLMSLNLTKARSAANELLHHAKRQGKTIAIQEGYIAVANTSFWLCECQDTMAILSESRLLEEEEKAETYTTSHQIDLVSLGIMLNGLAGFQLGDFAAARKALDTLVARSEFSPPEVKDRCFILQGIAWLGCLLEEWELMKTASIELKENSSAQQLAFYTGIGKIFYGRHCALAGRFAEAEKEMAEGYEHYVLYDGGMLFQSFQAWQRGEVLLMQNKAEQCIALLSPSIEIAIAHQERAYLAELMELRARALLALGEKVEAQREFECALSTACILSTVPARIMAAAQLKSLYGGTIPAKFEMDAAFFNAGSPNAPSGLQKYIALLQRG